MNTPSFARRDISENFRNNSMAIHGYAICCVILSLLGGVNYGLGDYKYLVADLLCYYGLLWIPLFISLIIKKKNADSKSICYVLYSSFFIFYTFVAFTGKHPLYGLSVIPMVIMAGSFGEAKFGEKVCFLSIIVDALGILYRAVIGDEAIECLDRIVVFGVVVVVAFIMNYVIKMIDARVDVKTTELNKERDRFKAIVSVGIARIFEYDIKKDMLMTSKSSEGNYGTEHYTCNFSSVAKQYRYILFSDWYKFDELINESKSGNGMVEKDMRIRNTAGDYRWYRVRGRIIFDVQGIPDKVIGSIEDIDDMKRLELRQADDNMRDPLTKLYRRPYVNQMIQEYLASQSGKDYSGLLILDIDDFENINSDMGKAFGDEILKNIAEDIDEIFYPTDILGRIGGDEFVILMKNVKTTEDIERKVIEIQRIIASTYVGESSKLGSTVGIGAAVYPLHGTDFETLYQNAKKALIDAQGKGHNHYGIYNPDRETAYSLIDSGLIMRNFGAFENEDGQSVTSDSLIELAFKLIEESKDTDSAINLLIRQVVRQLNITSISIMEKSSNDSKMTVLYQCGIDEEFDIEAGSVIEFTAEQWKSIGEYYSENNGLVAETDVLNMKDDVLRKLLLVYGIKSFAGCAFYDKGELIGNIIFMDYDKEHEWTNDERNAIRAVTNVVSSYLLKMKAYEDASDTVERLTGYDSVTGLYKYEKFLSLTGEYIASAPHGNYAIVYLDFSNFKYINESYGYETGDKVLHDLADAIMSYSEFVIYASRVFSDNLVALINVNDYDENSLKEAFIIAEKRFTDKIHKEYIDSRLVVDIGVCIFTISGGAVPIKNIISNANMARKQAKLPDMPRCIFYDDHMGSKMMDEITYANDMENAFRNREFVVYMQPKVNLKNNRIEGAEALIRWRRNDGNIIYPNDFIPVFEKNKSITLLDYYVYDEVCKYIRERMDNNLPVVRISVNVSRVHLYSINDIIGYIKGLLIKYNIPPKYLEFELTETSFTDKVDDTIMLMSRLRKLGVSVSMDDFGSGYSSLNVLTKLPLDVLKLDKEFLKDFETDSDEKIIIPSVVDMAKKLNLTVVCEGVETLEQVNFLRGIGCDYAQGYYYSKPIPRHEFDDMIEKQGILEAEEIV